MNHYAMSYLERHLKSEIVMLRRYLDAIEGSGQPYLELRNLLEQMELTHSIVSVSGVVPKHLGLSAKSLANRPRRENPRRGH